MTGSSSPLRLMWAGFLSIFVWGSIAGLLGSVLPSLRQRAGLSLLESGWLFVALSSGLVVASLLAGLLLDTVGRKQVLSAAVALVVLALVSLEFWNALPMLLLLAFLLGAGGSALVTAAHALIADLNPQHRSAALNLLDFFFGVGAFVTPSLIVPLQRTRGLTGVLFALAGLATLVLVYISTVAIPRPLQAREFSVADAARLLKSARFWVPAAIIFLYVGTEQSVWDWQVTYFMRQLQMDNIEAARVLSIFPIAIMLGRLGHNFLLRRVPAQPVLIASALGASLCFALMLGTRDARAASLGLFVAGLFMASVFPTTLGVISGRFPESSGTALGLAITGGWLGSVAISPSFGFVAHRSDFRTAYLVVVASATLMVVAAVALWRQGTATPQVAGAARAAAVETV
jgi:fucose permease